MPLERVGKMLKIFSLEELELKYPHKFRQRYAILRMLHAQTTPALAC
jgi:hypothetical protein